MSQSDAYRPATPAENLRAILALHSDLSPAEKRELEEAAVLLSERAAPSMTAREALEQAARIAERERIQDARLGFVALSADGREIAAEIRAIAASLPVDNAAGQDDRELPGSADAGNRSQLSPAPAAPDNAAGRENKAGSASDGAGLQAPDSMSRRLPNNPAPAAPAEAPTPETDELCEHGPGGAAISPHSLPFEILCRRLERQRDAALSRERLANRRADDIPTIIRRSTWRTPDLRESAARLVANILRDDDDPHPPVPPDHFPVA